MPVAKQRPAARSMKLLEAESLARDNELERRHRMLAERVAAMETREDARVADEVRRVDGIMAAIRHAKPRPRWRRVLPWVLVGALLVLAAVVTLAVSGWTR